MPAGWLASSIALAKLVDLVVTTPDWIMRMNSRKATAVKRRMVQRFRQIDLTLRQRSERDPRLAGMGTTLTVACSLGSHLFIGNIGDSRAYLQRGDDLLQLTRDDTLAQAMIEAGIGGAEEAVVHGMRRVLTAALGSTVKPTDPQVHQLYLKHGDQLLLCTDGLTESVDSETISSILRSSDSADSACRALVDAAMEAGSNDDVTVVLARYRFPRVS
jgi:protein phosphatase